MQIRIALFGFVTHADTPRLKDMPRGMQALMTKIAQIGVSKIKLAKTDNHFVVIAMPTNCFEAIDIRKL